MPWGESPHLSLHWFGLTDSLLWIQVGDKTIYEYAEASEKQFGGFTRYNDYQLSRFLEDFFRTFKHVGESIPREIYEVVEHYASRASDWEEQNEPEWDDDSQESKDLFDKFYFDEYCEPMEWYWDRSFDSGHLVGGPYISCFRCDNRIKILWESDFVTDEGESIWTSPKGCMEMPYDEFVKAVTVFFQEFCAAMDMQVEKALKKDWGEIQLDKKILAEENIRRKEGFTKDIEFLHKTWSGTDWDRAMELFRKVQNID